MSLKHLTEADHLTDVQETTFSYDVVGRYICNTWEEAVSNGGAPFDVIVLGAGMFGAYCATKVFRGGTKRVLVLEAGGFLVSEHVQNMARLGLNVPAPVFTDPGVARERVWGLPWRSNQASPGLAYCIGGRSLFWGGWAPRLTGADHALWPAGIAHYLDEHYLHVESEIGVVPGTEFIKGDLHTALFDRLTDVHTSVAHLDAVEEAPLAVQGEAPDSGLFSFGELTPD